MGKKVLLSFMFLYIFTINIPTLYARSEKIRYECKILFTRYHVDNTTKSYKGWMRVCGNNKLHLYTKQKYIDSVDKINICNCFKNNYKTRDVEVIRSSE